LKGRGAFAIIWRIGLAGWPPSKDNRRMNKPHSAPRAKQWTCVAAFALAAFSAQPASACEVLNRDQVRYFTGFFIASHYCPFAKKPMDGAQLFVMLQTFKYVSDGSPMEGNCVEIMKEEKDAGLAIVQKDKDGVCNWAKGQLEKNGVLREFFSKVGIF
jgi:hypothetical protein